ncbi:aminotransferase class I/II-fold pyridoxal phosphate-dependent enzyme [Streptomyces sp. NPDC096339]|uniref:aminotransferase class I/II-fold pyridoxal phosphate-dependent enzyme n=1 Tax=Streptomyces sp. NPDC096339 TaxID=3366086 RepID=UPI003812AF9C
MPLAIGSYENLSALADEAGLLNLAWTQDEQPLLKADLRGLVAAELAEEAAGGLPHVGDYLVKDPYGEGLLGETVARYFGRPGWNASVTCGAGVGPLLHGLAGLARNGTVHVVTDVYPDFPHWVRSVGGRCLPQGEGGPPSVLLLERPALSGGGFDDLEAVRELCARAERAGAVVLVDESNANYCPPEYSAANLAPAVAGLVVVRGLSKAYGLGGVRLGYAVASAALTARVRAVVPPLQPSSLSLRLGRRVLELGDVTGPLRARIADVRPRVRALLSASGLASATEAASHLPYVLVPEDPEGAVAHLRERGVQAKAHPVWSSRSGEPTRTARVSVPLDPSRTAELERRLSIPE